MEKTDLRNALMAQLWRMYRMDIMFYLREFLVGETALLECLNAYLQPLTPSVISEEMHLSRARTANILRTVRGKGFIEMQVAEDDRRKMYVTLTEAGKRHLAEKHVYLERYFDMYVDVLGEENISGLTALLKVTADSEDKLMTMFGKDGLKQRIEGEE